MRLKLLLIIPLLLSCTEKKYGPDPMVEYEIARKNIQYWCGNWANYVTEPQKLKDKEKCDKEKKERQAKLDKLTAKLGDEKYRVITTDPIHLCPEFKDYSSAYFSCVEEVENMAKAIARDVGDL